MRTYILESIRTIYSIRHKNGALIPKFRNRLDLLVQNQHHDFWWEQVLYSMAQEEPIWTEDIAGNFWAEIDFIEDYHRILEYRKQCHRI